MGNGESLPVRMLVGIHCYCYAAFTPYNGTKNVCATGHVNFSDLKMLQNFVERNWAGGYPTILQDLLRTYLHGWWAPALELTSSDCEPYSNIKLFHLAPPRQPPSQ